MEQTQQDMEKLYYQLGEVAEMLSESASLVRYWSNAFSKYVKPVRNAKGNRQYRMEDVEVLKQIHFLVKEKGLTLEGAARQLSAGKAAVSKQVRVLDSLKAIRARLVEVKKSL